MRLVKSTIVLPWTITRRVVGFGIGLVPGLRNTDPYTDSHGDFPPDDLTRDDFDGDASSAATDAIEREREPAEEAIFTPPDDFFDDEAGHVDQELELVAESHDPEAAEPPGATLHVDEPWDGYRRMKVAEITAQLEGQPPEVLAAVELYESTHRKRRGVLDAVAAANRG